jgi:hypothetical protein
MDPKLPYGKGIKLDLVDLRVILRRVSLVWTAMTNRLVVGSLLKYKTCYRPAFKYHIAHASGRNIGVPYSNLP